MPSSSPGSTPLLPRRLPSFLPGFLPILLLGAVAGLPACEGGPGTSPEEEFRELAREHLPTLDGTLPVEGLNDEVVVVRDPWGVPHIYARNLEDLFFAQGFVQAQDRLWQMEMYRRTGEGRLAEILGPDALPHDRLARLLKYRGPWDEAEFGSYHPEGRRILEAFSRGVNAYMEHPEEPLPVEFELTGIQPEPWTARTPLLRMQTAMPLGDARMELRLAQQVARLGPEEANLRARPTPFRELGVPSGVDLSLIGEEVLDALGGFQSGMPRPPLDPPYDEWLRGGPSENEGAREESPGSNNWVLAPRLTASGEVLLANDPHRAVTNPSLRYVVHLDAPGWTAIGSTEPVLPGVAIGHNGRVAWGLTIVGTDQSDVYVEELHPEDPGMVRWLDGWEPLTVIRDTIRVRGGESEVVELKYSRHGPVFHEDLEHRRAYALRSTMHEPGTTGYLSALRLNGVGDCREFLEELAYWKAPTENMICGDAEGNIAWQASALSPRREGWMGRLPVPGVGTYEWQGFRNDLPAELNPQRGWIATANHDIHPPGYDPPLFFKSGSSFPRYQRIAEVLNQGGPFSLEDARVLQQDALSPRALGMLEAFRGWTASDPDVELARQDLATWDGVFGKDSRAALLYDRFQRMLSDPMGMAPVSDPRFQRIAGAALAETVQRLREEFGEDREDWRWGRVHRSEFPHSLVPAYDIPGVERSGGAGTVAATGATYRHIIDFSDLDGSLGTNAPGQSERPGSPFYGNLTRSWGAGEYFPLLFSREAVEAQAQHRLVLRPGNQ